MASPAKAGNNRGGTACGWQLPFGHDDPEALVNHSAGEDGLASLSLIYST